MPDTALAMFAEELQARREEACLTQDQLAEKALISASLLRKIETCKRRPQGDFAAWCDKFFGCPGTFKRFHRLTLLETFPAWFAPRMDYEEQAGVITEWEMRFVPGLLQTRGYAQEIIRGGRPFDSESDLARELDARMERQEIFNRDSPPQLWALIAEGPLRQVVGGPEIMREQLDHLIEVADTPKCVLQILPSNSTATPGSDGPATLFEFADRHPVAYLEGWDIGCVIEDQAKVTRILTTFSMIKGCALSPTDSRNLLIRIRNEL